MRQLDPVLQKAAELLATVVCQDLDCGEDGVFRTARRVAKDRVISTVDPDARHGHKTSARGFDGYKGECRYRHSPFNAELRVMPRSS